MKNSKIKFLMLMMAGLLIFASLPQAVMANTTNPTTVVAWGFNGEGQCNVPAGLTDTTAIAAGGHHTIALKTDGTVVAWGHNGVEQCNAPAGLTEVSAIAGGLVHTVALKADGTVAAWGLNDSGACNVPAGLSVVKAIAGGSYHTVVLKEDGTVVTWGNNDFGQCTVPAGLTDVAAIAAGNFHTVALKEDGTVVAWGRNDHGQCNVPAGLTNVKAIIAGGFHTVALKTDGTVVAWGHNGAGQCNAPGGLTDVKAIAAGYLHTVALKADGTVVAWGWNYYGQCNVPADLFDVTAISAGQFYTVALVNNVSITDYTVNFDAGGGTPVPDSQIVAEGGMATEPTAPTKAGLTFGGWYTNAELTNTFNFATPITADTNLYAKWTSAVSFNANGGTPVPDNQTVAEGGMATAPAAPIKVGLTFGGWYSNAELTTPFDFTTPITSDMTLNARWLAPSDLIVQLRAYVVDNIANGNITKLGNSLIAKLDNIAAKLERGDTEAALNQLDAFINEVAAQQGKNIEPATADQLIQKAQLIILTISQV